MNRLPSIVRQHIAAFRLLLVFTVLTGIIYPVFMWGVAQGAFHNQANGSLVSYHGRVIGSSLLCQEFVDAKGNPLPQYFQPRPSAAILAGAKNDYGCDPRYSSASNYGPNNPAFVSLIKQRQKQIAAFDHVKISQIPANAVTASGSGLDPDISPANAAIQVEPGRGDAAHQPGRRPGAGRPVHDGPDARLPWRAGGERAAAEPGPRPEVPAALNGG